MKVMTFVVEGSGAFPLDMLRYDSCFPSAGDDVAAMDVRGKRRVTLSRHVASFAEANRVLTPARWASFGWQVLPALTKVR